MKNKKWFCTDNHLLEAVTFQSKARNCPTVTEFRYGYTAENMVYFALSYDHTHYVEALILKHTLQLMDRNGNQTSIIFHPKAQCYNHHLLLHHLPDQKKLVGVLIKQPDLPWLQILNVSQLLDPQ